MLHSVPRAYWHASQSGSSREQACGTSAGWLKSASDGAAAEAGAASACRRVLADHYKKNGEVVEEALALMRNLVAGDSTICREAIVKSDGIKMIINAMEENIENIQICVQGSLAIRNLACGDHKLLQALVDANGVQVLIQALKLHKPEKVGKNAQYAELTRAVCAALRNLAVDGWMAVARKYGMAAAPAAAAAGAQTAGAVSQH